MNTATQLTTEAQRRTQALKQARSDLRAIFKTTELAELQNLLAKELRDRRHPAIISTLKLKIQIAESPIK